MARNFELWMFYGGCRFIVCFWVICSLVLIWLVLVGDFCLVVCFVVWVWALVLWVAVLCCGFLWGAFDLKPSSALGCWVHDCAADLALLY